LGYQDDYLDTNPHLGVLHRLEKIPPGWLHYGPRNAVPACARYKGHKGQTWVWVMPNDTEAFAQFTLVLHDIATLDWSVITTPPLLVTLTTSERTKLPDPTAKADDKKAVIISTSETRSVKREYRTEIEKAIQKGMESGQVNLTRAQWLAYTDPWFGTRYYPVPTPAATQPGRSSPTQLQLPASAGTPAPLVPYLRILQ
jgi:hypothetical protein